MEAAPRPEIDAAPLRAAHSPRKRLPLARTLVLGLTLLPVAAGTLHAQEPEPASFDAVCRQAESALDHGRLDHAQQHLARALALADAAGRRSAEQARVRLALARLQRLRGDSRQARDQLALARRATRHAHGADSLAMAEVEIEEARQHQGTGSHEQAVAAVEEALRIRRERLPPGDPLRIDTELELAFAHHLSFQYPRAIAVYGQALEDMAQASKNRDRDRVVTLNRMAWIYARAAMPERAAALNARARALVAAGSQRAGRDERLLRIGVEVLDDTTPDHGDTLAKLKALIEAWIDERGYHREHFAIDRQLLVSLRRLDRGMPVHKVEFALQRDLRAEFLSFAPAQPRGDAHHRYGLPFVSTVPREVSTRSDGAHGFERVLLHAVDFEVPPGTPVIAAREGTVVRVVHGLPAGADDTLKPEDDLQHGIRVNHVIVLHDDDTYATYQPLSPEILVSEGEYVERGQRLGSTSRVSDGRPAVVHFDVRRNSRSAGSGGVVTSEPVRARFASVSDRDGIPLPGHRYGGVAAAAPSPYPRD